MHEVRNWHFRDIARSQIDFRFSNRPLRVKAFRLSTHYSVDVAHGLVLLYGIGTKAVPSWDSKTGWNNLSGVSVVECFETDGGVNYRSVRLIWF